MEELIFKYFPNLDSTATERLSMLGGLYREWNQKINVISRKDIDNIYLHHILHSLSISKFTSFPLGSSVLDVGTGGGFPGIPLAIIYPQTHFLLCDSIGKKIKVVEEVSKALNLTNVQTLHGRAEQIDHLFDFVISRAVTELSQFIPWVWNKIERGNIGGATRGIIALKGGDVHAEIDDASKKCKIEREKFTVIEISEWFNEEWFNEKRVVFIER